MDYLKVHDQIINRGKTRKLTGYKERHHIIPKCMGGGNSKDNLVDLSAREHFIIHWLLHRIYPDNGSLAIAFYRCANIKNGLLPSSRSYEEARKVSSNAQSIMKKQKYKDGEITVWNKGLSGYSISSENMKGKEPWNKGKTGFIPWNKGLTKHTDERLKLSGEKVTKQLKENYASGKIKPPMEGKFHTQESKDKVKIANKGKIPWNKKKTM